MREEQEELDFLDPTWFLQVTQMVPWKFMVCCVFCGREEMKKRNANETWKQMKMKNK